MNDNINSWGACNPPPFAGFCLAALRSGMARGVMKRPFRAYLRKKRFVVDMDVQGIKMRCHFGDNITERAIIERRRHSDLANVERIIGDLEPGDAFVDVGANCGLYSLFAARKVGPQGTVIAIEPLPVMIDRLKFNIALNGFAWVTVFRAAIGDGTGEIVMYVNKRQYGLSCAAYKANRTPVTVPLSTLVGLVAASGVNRIDFLKIDIEGYEDHALLPFLRDAPRSLWPRRILLEITHRAQWVTDCIAALTAMGYGIAWTGKSDLLLADQARG